MTVTGTWHVLACFSPGKLDSAGRPRCSSTRDSAEEEEPQQGTSAPEARGTSWAAFWLFNFSSMEWRGWDVVRPALPIQAEFPSGVYFSLIKAITRAASSEGLPWRPSARPPESFLPEHAAAIVS